MSSNLTTADVPSLDVSFQLIVGPLLIGVVINALVFGICIMQLVTYFWSRYADGWHILSLLAWIYIIDTFQVCSSISMLWHYVVDNFANPPALAFSPWEYATLPIFSSLASVPIQHFMAFRIMRFSGSRILFVYISLLSWAQASLAVTSAIQGVLHTSIESHKSIIPFADAWLALSVACDLSITVLLLYYLLKSRTGFERTDSIISTICATTVKAAVPVTLLCILDLCFLTTTPNNNLHYMFALPVGRLLTNTLMSTLNERKNLRSQMENSTPNRGINLSALTNSKHRFQVHPAQVRINIEHDTDAPTYPYPYPIDSTYPRRSSALPSSSPTSPISPTYPISPISPITPRGQNVRWSRNPSSGIGMRGMGMGMAITTDDKYRDHDIDIEEIQSQSDTDTTEKSDSLDDKASPLTESESESPSSALEQRVVVGNLPRLPRLGAGTATAGPGGDACGLGADAEREREREREREGGEEEEVERGLAGGRVERHGVGVAFGY